MNTPAISAAPVASAMSAAPDNSATPAVPSCATRTRHSFAQEGTGLKNRSHANGANTIGTSWRMRTILTCLSIMLCLADRALAAPPVCSIEDVTYANGDYLHPDAIIDGLNEFGDPIDPTVKISFLIYDLDCDLASYRLNILSPDGTLSNNNGNFIALTPSEIEYSEIQYTITLPLTQNGTWRIWMEARDSQQEASGGLSQSSTISLTVAIPDTSQETKTNADSPPLAFDSITSTIHNDLSMTGTRGTAGNAGLFSKAGKTSTVIGSNLPRFNSYYRPLGVDYARVGWISPFSNLKSKIHLSP